MRRSLLTRSPTVVAEDQFTDTDTTTIAAHVPVGFTAGASWTKHTSGGASAGDATVQSNRAMNSNDATFHPYYHSWAPSNPNYLVEADAVTLSDNNGSVVGVTGRLTTGANTYYLAWLNSSGNSFQLWKFVAGVATQLGSTVAQTPVAGVTYRLGLDMHGQRIAMLVNGAVIISARDAAIPGPGRAGIYIQNQATSITGLHVDSWSVRM